MKDMSEKSHEPPRFISYPEVKKLTGLSRTTVWKLERDGEFPRRRNVTAKRRAWLESEVHAWIKGRSQTVLKDQVLVDREEIAEGQSTHNSPNNEKDHR